MTAPAPTGEGRFMQLSSQSMFPSPSPALPVFERPPHPFVRAKPLPPPDTISPQTRELFERTDMQIASLVAPEGQRVRRSEFHNSVDDRGNTYNAYASSFHVSVPMALTSLALVLVAGSVGLAMFAGNGREALAFSGTASADDAAASSASIAASAQAVDHDAVHVIEWEDPQPEQADSHSDRYTWSELVALCSGDVMAAAAAIKNEASLDAALDPSSTDAFRRAIESVRNTSLVVPT